MQSPIEIGARPRDIMSCSWQLKRTFVRLLIHSMLVLDYSEQNCSSGVTIHIYPDKKIIMFIDTVSLVLYQDDHRTLQVSIKYSLHSLFPEFGHAGFVEPMKQQGRWRMIPSMTSSNIQSKWCTYYYFGNYMVFPPKKYPQKYTKNALRGNFWVENGTLQYLVKILVWH